MDLVLYTLVQLGRAISWGQVSHFDFLSPNLGVNLLLNGYTLAGKVDLFNRYGLNRNFIYAHINLGIVHRV